MQKIIQSCLVWFVILFALIAVETRAQAVNDREAIKQTALDYIEGFYDGNTERMERSLHPDLAKRIVRTDPSSGKQRVENMTAARLVQATQMKKDRPTPKEKQQKDVTILDLYENSASVKIVAADWIDYLHLSRIDGRWVIVNVLWEMKPVKK